MCLILVAHRAHADLPLIVAANRDEFYARPTASAHFWSGPAGLLAGKDLEAGGTWLGVDERGRFAAVTNFGEMPPAEVKQSRGTLVQNFLTGHNAAERYAAEIDGERYRGFNLLLWDGNTLVFRSNRSETQVLGPGVYGLANATLDEQRHKVLRGKAALNELAVAPPAAETLDTALLNLLADRVAPDNAEGREIPGRSPEELINMGACFITGDDYGTRASSAVSISPTSVRFCEQIYGTGGVAKGNSRHCFARRRD